MGRKRDKGFDVSSKRRTILQIEKPSLKSGHKDSSSHVEGSNLPKGKVPNPLGLLASYGDSDDEDLDEDAPRPAKGGFIGVDGTKPKNEMDDKVADFLAEIDALDPDTPERSSEPDGTENTSKSAQEAETALPAPAPLANNGWQELLDENTNCIYYWNTVTNNVTWEMPPDYQVPVAIEQAPSQPSSGISTPVPLEEPIVEAEKSLLPLPKEEPPKVVEKKNIAKEEKSIKQDTIKKVSLKVPVKPPVLDMFADDAEEVEDKKTSTNKISKKMPVYGTLKVQYDVPDVPLEKVKDSKPELESEPSEAKAKNPGAYPMFVKGSVLPGSKESEKQSVKKSVKNVVLAHLDITEDDDANEIQTNGASNAGKTSVGEVEDDDVVEMDMGDDIDIDAQLELALERKKAELAELEELEELEKGISTPPPLKRKSSSTLNIYDQKGEVNLLSFKKKRLENMKGQKQVSTCDKGTQCDEELLEKMSVDNEQFKSAKKIKEEADLKAKVSDLGSTLTSKLEFLGQARKEFPKLQVLLVEIETRILDWREGALDSKHLLNKLQIADWELQRYETEASPCNWTCTWNRTHRQYYYTNLATGESQWDYPVEAFTKDQDNQEQSKDERESGVMFNRASSQDDSQAKARGSFAILHGSVTTGQLHVQGTPDVPVPASNAADPPVINLVAPPPPSTPSPEPPPPPLPDLAPPLPNDPPPPGTGPDLPPLPPSPPPPPPSPPEDSEDDEESDSTSSRPLTPPPLPPFASEATSHYGLPPLPPEPDGTVIGKPQLLYTNATVAAGASILHPPEVAGIDGMPLGDYGGAPVTYGTQPGATSEAVGGGVQVSQPAAVKTKKTKKVKKTSAVKKKMPLSLVEKWKQIQEAQAKEEEEKRRKEEEEDMVLDPSIIQKRRIEEWKKQQLEDGKLTYNPNFETIKGDWRDRLKRK